MKRFLAVLISSAAIAATTGGQYGGELRFCLYSEPKTFNPLLVADTRALQGMYLAPIPNATAGVFYSHQIGASDGVAPILRVAVAGPTVTLLTAPVAEAYDAGIPVFVLDRNVEGDKYTCFIGADNVEIGRQAGQYAVKLLGGQGKATGIYVEVWGGFGTKPSHDRSQGFHEVVDKERGMKKVGQKVDCDWKLEKAQNYLEGVLKLYPQIDLVYAHNDPMAMGARQAAEAVNRADAIKFLGIDGLPNEGVQWVKQGKLAATFLYPTPGVRGLQDGLLDPAVHAGVGAED